MLGSFGILDGEYDEFTVQDNLTDLVTGEEIILTRDLSDTEVVRGSDLLESTPRQILRAHLQYPGDPAFIPPRQVRLAGWAGCLDLAEWADLNITLG